MKKPLGGKYPANPATLGEHIRKVRMENDLLQEDVAKLLGVCTDSITGWETGRSAPQIRYYPQIFAFLGFNPLTTEEEGLGEKIKQYRKLNGLSHKKMGKLIGVDPGTISTWESGKHQPLGKFFKKLITLLHSCKLPFSGQLFFERLVNI